MKRNNLFEIYNYYSNNTLFGATKHYQINYRSSERRKIKKLGHLMVIVVGAFYLMVVAFFLELLYVCRNI